MVRQVRRSPEIEDAILDRLAGGESLRRICDDADMPHVRNVLRWVIDDAEFATKYARARQAQAELLVDEMQEIADNGRNDWMEANGQDAAGWRANGEAVARSKLRLEQRRWYAEKLRPKVYGPKLDLHHSGTLNVGSELAALNAAAKPKDAAPD